MPEFPSATSTALAPRLSRQHAYSHALRVRWCVRLEGESAPSFWRQLRIYGAVRSMVERDDKRVARFFICTRPSEDVALLAVPRHAREPSVTMMPLIAAPTPLDSFHWHSIGRYCERSAMDGHPRLRRVRARISMLVTDDPGWLCLVVGCFPLSAHVLKDRLELMV